MHLLTRAQLSTQVCCCCPHLLGLILLFLFEDVSEVNELLHGFYLPAEMLKVHATSPAVSLQKQAKPLAYCLIVHF